MTYLKKIFINHKGFLSVQRDEDYDVEKILCPFSPDSKNCGEWCPHFGTPQKSYVRTKTGQLVECTIIDLSCGKHESALLALSFIRVPDHLAELKDIMNPNLPGYKGGPITFNECTEGVNNHD